MDIAAACAEAMQKHLNFTAVCQGIGGLSEPNLTQYVNSFCNRLHTKMVGIIEAAGKPYIEKNSAFGLTALLAEGGIKLPFTTIYDMAKTIIYRARNELVWVGPSADGDGEVWGMRMIVDVGNIDSGSIKPNNLK